MLNFTDLLQGKYDLKPPPVGAGRVHLMDKTGKPGNPNIGQASRGTLAKRGAAIARNRAAVLAAIGEGIETITAIADATGFSRSGVQGHVDILLADGAVVRSAKVTKGAGYCYLVGNV